MYTSKAIVLTRSPRGEADYQITFFTEEFGLVTVVAQGIRKLEAKLKGHVEPLSLTSIAFVEGKTGYRLVSAELISPHTEILLRIEKKKVAEAIARILATITFPGEERVIWQDLNTLFAWLDARDSRSQASLVSALHWFLLHLLRELGYQSSEEMGHEKGVSRDSIRAIEESNLESAASLPTATDGEILKLISRSFERHFGYRFLFLSSSFRVLSRG